MCLEFQQGAAEMSGQSRKVDPSLSTAYTTAASAQPQGTTRPHLGEMENESTPVPHPDLGESMGERERGRIPAEPWTDLFKVMAAQPPTYPVQRAEGRAGQKPTLLP